MTRTFLSLAALAKTTLLICLLLTIGCKKDSPTDPAANNLTSLQGSWKITGVTVSPAYSGVTDLATGLQLLNEFCLKDAVVTFNAGGTISNNLASQASCTNATNTQRLVTTFFGPATRYTESGSQVSLITNGQTVTGTSVYTATTVTLTASLPTDPGNAPIPTTYVVTLTKQ